MSIKNVLQTIEPVLFNEASVPLKDVPTSNLSKDDRKLLVEIARNENIDLGDCFKLLSQVLSGQNKYGIDEEDKSSLIRIMGYTGGMLDNVDVELVTVKLSGGEEIGSIKFKPKGNVKLERDPIIGSGGYLHSIDLVKGASKIVNELKCELVLYDLPSMGASQLNPNESVSPRMTREALLKTIEAHYPHGTRLNLYGFSMSVYPLTSTSELKENPNGDGYLAGQPLIETNYVVNRNILIAPVPAMGETPEGVPINTKFSRWSAIQMPFRWANLKTGNLNVFFDPDKNPEAARLVSREIVRINLLDFSSFLISMDITMPYTRLIGHDPRWRLILSENDNLARNPDLHNKRGVKYISGNHSDPLINPEYTKTFVGALKWAIDEPLDYSKEPPTLFDIHKGPFSDIVASLGYNNGSGKLDVSTYIATGLPGLAMRMGPVLSGDFDSEDIGVTALGRIELRGNYLPLPWIGIYSFLQRGARSGTDDSSMEITPFELGTGVSLNINGIFDIQAGTLSPIYDPLDASLYLFANFSLMK